MEKTDLASAYRRLRSSNRKTKIIKAHKKNK